MVPMYRINELQQFSKLCKWFNETPCVRYFVSQPVVLASKSFLLSVWSSNFPEAKNRVSLIWDKTLELGISDDTECNKHVNFVVSQQTTQRGKYARAGAPMRRMTHDYTAWWFTFRYDYRYALSVHSVRNFVRWTATIFWAIIIHSTCTYRTKHTLIVLPFPAFLIQPMLFRVKKKNCYLSRSYSPAEP